MSTKLRKVIAEELKVMGESFIRISQAFAMEDEAKEIKNEVLDVVKETKVEDTKTAQKEQKEELTNVKEEKVVEEVVKDEETESSNGYTIEQLQKMTYNDVRKLAKELGVTATGAKLTIIERILESSNELSEDNGTDEEPVIEEPKEEEPKEIVNDEPSQEEEDDDDVPVEDEEMDEETISTQVEKELADYSLEEIADVLESIGISPKGKRQALIAKVVKAVEEGLLAFDDEEEDQEEEPQTKTDTNPVDEVEEESHDEPQEEENTKTEGEFLLECSTNVRRKVVSDKNIEVEEAIKNEEFSDKELNEFLEDFYLPHEGFKKTLPKDEKIDMLKELYARMIDDEGNEHDFQEPYYINDEPVCCGHLLQYDEENKEFVCPVCANKYSEE